MFGLCQGGVAALVLFAACSQELPGEAPPSDSFYYPMGIASSPDGAFLYVVSSNFDLKYNAGWVSTVSVDTLLAAVDSDDDPRDSIVSTVKVPPLGGDLDVDASGSMAILAARGGMPVTVLDVDQEKLSCGAPEATDGLSTQLRKTDCDADHFTFIDVDLVADDIVDGTEVQDWELEDPYAARIFSRADAPETIYAAVSYMSSGRLSLFEIDSASSSLEHVRLMRPRQGAPMQALAVYPSATQTFIAGANRSSTLAGARIFDIDVARSMDERIDRTRAVEVYKDVGGSEITAIAFEPNGERAFAALRFPDAIASLDTTLKAYQEGGNPNGTYNNGILRPAYETVAAQSVSGRPSAVTWVPRSAGALVAVTAFDDDVLLLVDPSAVDLRILRRFDRIAQGPFRMTALSRGGRDFIFITAFFDHSVVVVDVTAEDPMSFEVVAQIANEELQPDGPPNR